MDMLKKLLGAEHPKTLNSIAQLANTYCDQGRLNEAEQLVVQLVDVEKTVLGAEHPDTLTSMKNLASTYRYQGRVCEAERVELEVMNIKIRIGRN